MGSKKGAVNEHVADYDIKHNKEGVKSGDTRRRLENKQVGAELMKQSPSPRVPIAPEGSESAPCFFSISSTYWGIIWPMRYVLVRNSSSLCVVVGAETVAFNYQLAGFLFRLRRSRDG
jgi:hypothetical protein